VQPPELIAVTVVPETVQVAGVVDAKLTGSPEVAEAVKVSVPVPTPNVRSERGENEMVWDES
jgi:hypothetical protein